MPTTIPARTGAHIKLLADQKLKVINPSGHQVADLWAFSLHDARPAWLSMAQTRSKSLKLRPAVDDVLIDSRREPLLKLIDDSTKGVHDMLFPACDQWRYKQAGVEGHDSCGGNLRKELAAFLDGLEERSEALGDLEACIRRWGWTPEPFNVFMNVAWSDNTEGRLSVKAPDCRPGEYIVLEACVDCIVVVSACPNDLMDTNGGMPGSIEYEIVS